MSGDYLTDTPTQAKIRSAVKSLFTANSLENKSVVPLDATIKADILESGIFVSGGPKSGKTNLVMDIAGQLMKDDNIQLKVFDSAQNYVHNFENITYQDLDIDTLENEGFYFGDQSILFNMNIVTPKDSKKTISEIVSYDYEYQRQLKEIGEMNRWIVYVVEEAQNILYNVGDTDVWRTFISQGRNFNLAFIFITRRMAEVHPKVRSHMRGFMWGRPNDALEIEKATKAMGEEIAMMLPKLNTGEFIYWRGLNGYTINNVPLYKSSTNPTKWDGKC